MKRTKIIAKVDIIGIHGQVVAKNKNVIFDNMNWRTYVNLKVGKSYRKYDVIKRGKRFQLLNRISLRPLR